MEWMIVGVWVIAGLLLLLVLAHKRASELLGWTLRGAWSGVWVLVLLAGAVVEVLLIYLIFTGQWEDFWNQF